MEYSEIVLIALVLLVVFCGMQIFKLVSLLSPRRSGLDSVKTIVKASDTIQMPRKVADQKPVVSVKAKLPSTKKNISKVKRTSAKKTTAKKTVSKKAVSAKKMVTASKAAAKKKTVKK